MMLRGLVPALTLRAVSGPGPGAEKETKKKKEHKMTHKSNKRL